MEFRSCFEGTSLLGLLLTSLLSRRLVGSHVEIDEKVEVRGDEEGT